MRFQEALVRDELSACIVNKKIYKSLQVPRDEVIFNIGNIQI